MPRLVDEDMEVGFVGPVLNANVNHLKFLERYWSFESQKGRQRHDATKKHIKKRQSKTIL